VLQDAFDLAALRDVLRRIEAGEITLRTVATEVPSPMALSLQFGFVMDWMYADDTPRAERAAAMLSLDTALLEDLLGTTGELDEGLAEALADLVARRRGTHPDRRARTADELALLLDRAGDLTEAELRERVSDTAAIGDPAAELRSGSRTVEIAIPTAQGVERRVVLVESVPRYVSAFSSIEIPANVPDAFRRGSLTQIAARREILSRMLALSGPVTIDDIRARYAFDREWIEQRLTELVDRGKLLRGRFGVTGSATEVRWCSKRLLEQARRRALAAARKQVEAVEFDAFSRFMLEWQHVAPGARAGAEQVADVVRQLYGIARPPLAWEAEYLRARIEGTSVSPLSALSSSGELVWVGEGTPEADAASTRLRAVRLLKRGQERAWLRPIEKPQLSDRAITVRDQLRARGASFFFELQQATRLGSHALRDALRELVVAGLLTNDTVDALTQVARWRPLFQDASAAEQDPTRWLPADFVPSPNRPVVQRRVNIRRLPKWKRPDREGGDVPWPGRWSLVDRSATPTHHLDQEESGLASAVAAQWLERYGVVTRDWWRRERPPIPWRAIYRELRRMEMRGDVRRGYFVRGLAGAQFALPAAVEQLRAAAIARDEPPIVIAASDPANVWSLPAAADGSRRIARPRGARALLVMVAGNVVLSSDAYARAISVHPDLTSTQVTDAVRALIRHITGRRARDLTVETIDGARAATSPHTAAFTAAGLRLTTAGLRYYTSLDRR